MKSKKDRHEKEMKLWERREKLLVNMEPRIEDRESNRWRKESREMERRMIPSLRAR